MNPIPHIHSRLEAPDTSCAFSGLERLANRVSLGVPETSCFPRTSDYHASLLFRGYSHGFLKIGLDVVPGF